MARTETETTGGDGRMLGYSEVAERLGVSASTVSRLVTGGVLPSVRSGRRSVRIAPEALERFKRQGGIVAGATRKGRTARDG